MTFHNLNQREQTGQWVLFSLCMDFSHKVWLSLGDIKLLPLLKEILHKIWLSRFSYKNAWCGNTGTTFPCGNNWLKLTIVWRDMVPTFRTASYCLIYLPSFIHFACVTPTTALRVSQGGFRALGPLPPKQLHFNQFYILASQIRYLWRFSANNSLKI